MKTIEIKRAEADARRDAYAKLTLDEKIAKAKAAPGKCARQLRKLLRQKEG